MHRWRLIRVLVLSAFVSAVSAAPYDQEHGAVYGSRQKLKPYAEFIADLADRPGRVIYTPYPVAATRGLVRGFVHVSDGTAVLARTDLVVDAPMPIVVRRAYDSSRTRSADFGVGGWHLTLAEIVDVGAAGDLVYIYGNGTRLELDRRGRPRSPVQAHFADVVDVAPSATSLEVRVRTGLIKRFERKGNRYRLASVTDAYDNSLTLLYAPGGSLARIVASSGAWAAIERDEYGRIASVADSNGRAVLYQYDDAGRLSGVTDTGKLEWHYAYDAAQRLLRTSTPNGIDDVALEYDKVGRVTQSRASAARHTFDYDGPRTRVTGTKGLTTTYTASASGLTVLIANALGTQTALGLDASGLPWRLDRNGVPIAELTLKSSAGGALMVLDPNAGAQARRISFDALGRATAVIGGADAYRYQVGQYGPGLIPEHMVYGDGTEQVAQFDTHGELLLHADRSGDTLTFERADRRLSIHNGANRQVDLQFNALGRLVRATTPAGYVFEFGYNDVGLRELTATSYGALVRYQYNASGSLFHSQVSDAQGTKPAYAYVLGEDQRVDAVAGSDGSRTQFEYGARGELREVRAPGEPTLRFEYDNLQRLSRVLREGREPLGYDYAPGEPDVVGQLTARAVPVYNQQREITDFASRFEIAFTRIRPAALGFFAYDDAADEIRVAADPSSWDPGAVIRRSIEALRIRHVLSENPRHVPHFVTPSNRLFVPAEYWSVNCCICLCQDPDHDCYVP